MVETDWERLADGVEALVGPNAEVIEGGAAARAHEVEMIRARYARLCREQRLSRVQQRLRIDARRLAAIAAGEPYVEHDGDEV